MTRTELEKAIDHLVDCAKKGDSKEPVVGSIMSAVDRFTAGVIGKNVKPHGVSNLNITSNIYLSEEEMSQNDLRAEQRQRAGLEGKK